MIPITPVVPGFDLDTVVFGKNQPEYLPLPGIKLPDGTVVTRWHLTLKERFLIAIGGSLWVSLLTFNRPLQPIKLTAQCPIMGHTGYDKEI